MNYIITFENKNDYSIKGLLKTFMYLILIFVSIIAASFNEGLGILLTAYFLSLVIMDYTKIKISKVNLGGYTNEK